MELYIRKEAGSAENPVFQKILEDIEGGVTLQLAAIPTDLKFIRQGTPVGASGTLGLYVPCKRAVSLKTHTAMKTLSVYPGHLFKAGDFLAKSTGTTASTIVSITHTSVTTDTILTGTAVGVLATNTVLHQTVTKGVASATIAQNRKNTPVAVLRDTVTVHDFSKAISTCYNVTAGAVVRGTVKEAVARATGIGFTAADKTSLTDRMRFVS